MRETFTMTTDLGHCRLLPLIVRRPLVDKFDIMDHHSGGHISEIRHLKPWSRRRTSNTNLSVCKQPFICLGRFNFYINFFNSPQIITVALPYTFDACHVNRHRRNTLIKKHVKKAEMLRIPNQYNVVYWNNTLVQIECQTVSSGVESTR